MNSLVIAALGLSLLYLGYRFYGSFVEKLWDVDPRRETPAVRKQDGIDYVPAKNWLILFGHHFASIAGAGPVIGPVIACVLWGWLPAVVWIIIGSIFLGGIHDFSALFISLRHEGRSIGDIAKTVINYRTKIIFSLFLWLALILVIAVFAAVGGKTLDAQPNIVIPTFGIIPVALLIGWMIYRWNINQYITTLIGVILLFALIVLGYHIPLTIAGGTKTWIKILLVYAFFASVLPVNFLLQPRDYLSTFVLFFGLFFGYIGLIWTHPVIHSPVFISWQTKQGPLWPMLSVIIACGAISGFHSLIAGGTTVKQLANEKYGKRIAYGGMIMEGVLALMTVLVVSAGLYWVKGSGPSSLIYPEIMKNEGWIVAFGKGYGEVTKPIFGGLGLLIGIIVLKTFVLTTLDSATRISRYITEEFFGEGLNMRFLKNRFISALFVIVSAAALALGNWKSIWPIFGAANQLVGALCLLIVSVYLLSKNKPARYTAWPAVFMIITTIAALVYKTNIFWTDKKFLLGFISVILLILSGFILVEAVLVIKKLKFQSSGRCNES
jgi:carbon starvation protein